MELAEPFKLTTRHEVERFQCLLSAYASARANFDLPYIPLVKAFDAMQAREDGAKVFTALVDLGKL